jgi:hypothetical protein
MSTPTPPAINSVRLLELLDYDKRAFAFHLTMLEASGPAGSELVNRILDGFGPHDKIKQTVEYYLSAARSVLERG